MAAVPARGLPRPKPSVSSRPSTSHWAQTAQGHKQYLNRAQAISESSDVAKYVHLTWYQSGNQAAQTPLILNGNETTWTTELHHGLTPPGAPMAKGTRLHTLEPQQTSWARRAQGPTSNLEIEHYKKIIFVQNHRNFNINMFIFFEIKSIFVSSNMYHY